MYAAASELANLPKYYFIDHLYPCLSLVYGREAFNQNFSLLSVTWGWHLPKAPSPEQSRRAAELCRVIQCSTGGASSRGRQRRNCQQLVVQGLGSSLSRSLLFFPPSERLPWLWAVASWPWASTTTVRWISAPPQTSSKNLLLGFLSAGGLSRGIEMKHWC